MYLVCFFLFLAGFCRTVNWSQRNPSIINKLDNIGDYKDEKQLFGLAQIQGLKWGGTAVFCLEGSHGLKGKSLVLYDHKMPHSGWIEFKLRATHPLARKGLQAFYSTSDLVKPSGALVWLMDKRLKLRDSLIAGLSQSTQFYESLRLFWSSAILRYDGENQYELKNNLKSLGLGAVFAVSGLHVNLLALLLVVVLSLIPLSVRQSWFLYIALVVLYAFIVGFTASVLRALCFAFLIRTADDCGLSGRNVRLLAAVFLVHILCFPSEVLEAGFLLSYGLTFLLIFLGLSFQVKNLMHLLLQGFGIQIILMPYFLWQFGEYPLMHFSCVFLAPIFTVILAVGFFVIFTSLFASNFVSVIVNLIGLPMELFVNFCSEWGKSSQLLLSSSESFDGRFVVLFYAIFLLLMMRIERIKLNVWQSSIDSWEAFLRKNREKPYELHATIYENLFNVSYEPALALKTLQVNARSRDWSYLAFSHLEQLWIKNSFENTINPLRPIVKRHYSGSKDLLDPLYVHFIENKLHIQWSKQNLLSLSSWLLHLTKNPEVADIFKQHRNALQNLVDCTFFASFEMRILGSSKSWVLNMLPTFLKNILVRHLIARFFCNHT